jgi:hypothetical protein
MRFRTDEHRFYCGVDLHARCCWPPLRADSATRKVTGEAETKKSTAIRALRKEQEEILQNPRCAC